MTATESRRRAAGQTEDRLYDVGRSAILVPLIIGGAVIVAIIILWRTHDQTVRMAEMSRIEEAARIELRSAYVEMRAMRTDSALEKAASARKLMHSLKTAHPADYVGLKIALLLIEAESLFMKDCSANAAEVEKRFDEALALMNFASGEMWQFCMLGRARAHFEQGEYAEAVSDLDSLMGRNPSYGAAYYWRSVAKERLGDLAGAREDEKRARSLDSWPPLRDFMAAGVLNRDVLCRPAFANCLPTNADAEEELLEP